MKGVLRRARRRAWWCKTSYLARLAVHSQPINHAGVANEFIYLGWMCDRNEQVWNFAVWEAGFCRLRTGSFQGASSSFCHLALLLQVCHRVSRFGVTQPKLCWRMKPRYVDWRTSGELSDWALTWLWLEYECHAHWHGNCMSCNWVIWDNSSTTTIEWQSALSAPKPTGSWKYSNIKKKKKGKINLRKCFST